MTINWTLRLVTGTVAREKDTASVNTTVYGTTAGDTTISARTAHSKQIWIESDAGQMVPAKLAHTENVSASPGDRVRVVFADPGGHVVGLRNETLQTTWKWKYPPTSSSTQLIMLLALLGLSIAGLVFLWRGDLLPAALSLSVVAYIVVVPLGRNRQRIRRLHNEREAMLNRPI